MDNISELRMKVSQTYLSELKNDHESNPDVYQFLRDVIEPEVYRLGRQKLIPSDVLLRLINSEYKQYIEKPLNSHFSTFLKETLEINREPYL
ncbi:hypothetical protein C9J48_01715 [Photobacterium profundum]|uniref:Uncharacterized protein n=1 Tax=Photobacterium profundum 3TCK TaxID=314280 RepID=Q1YW15_9GAMM|nr:hypothetical protein [Photobacterium profundum]EAS40496.1 hypothetical protein P3TCK_17537 [Photobacterium profundum 3TCK]PSV64201.1 hypothetical protein C9J48_01715 [Photobacterium profundum]